MDSNNDIQNAKTSILLPPLSFLKNAPFVMLSSGIIEKNVLLTYPMSLYTRDGNGKMNYLGFLYTFLFTGKDGSVVAAIALLLPDARQTPFTADISYIYVVFPVRPVSE